MRSILICLRKSKPNILKKSDTKKENHHLKIVSISPERQEIVIFNGNCHLSDWYAAGNGVFKRGGHDA